jgi:hypothetical protein
LERDSLSSFLRRGKTKDSLKWAGRRPVTREWLIIEVIVGIRREAHSLRRAVGMGWSRPGLMATYRIHN